jgi:hypothetical protein
MIPYFNFVFVGRQRDDFPQIRNLGVFSGARHNDQVQITACLIANSEKKT